MNFTISKHQLNQLTDLIQKEYRTFGTVKFEDKYLFEELKNQELIIPTPKSLLSFKEIIWPKKISLDFEIPKKIALIGVTNCDAIALFKLLKEIKGVVNFDRKNILVITSECITTDSCFCTLFKDYKIEHSDLHLQKEKGGGYTIFPFSKVGKKLLNQIEAKKSLDEIKLKKPELTDKKRIDQPLLCSRVDDKKNHADFWQKIANNCFGCGSCSAVCPLCFCTKLDYKNSTDGTCGKFLEQDSCFSKSFSEIQNHFDLRPTRTDRLYNWYHHKFTRSYIKHKEFLCTGCGRCIDACPAHLNQKRIIESIAKEDE